MIGLRLVAVLLAAAALTGCGGWSAGPLAENVDGRTLVSVPVNLGTPDSFGIPLYNRTSRALTLDRIVPVGVVGPLAVDGIAIATVRHGIVGSAHGFPPSQLGSSPLHPVKGWRIRAHSEAFQLIVGVHMTRPGEAHITKIRVEYHDAHTHYAVDFLYSLGECAPYKRWPHGCPQIPLPT